MTVNDQVFRASFFWLHPPLWFLQGESSEKRVMVLCPHLTHLCRKQKGDRAPREERDIAFSCCNFSILHGEVSLRYPRVLLVSKLLHQNSLVVSVDYDHREQTGRACSCHYLVSGGTFSQEDVHACRSLCSAPSPSPIQSL